MTIEQITTALQAKFTGARKDGLEQIARNLALVLGNDDNKVNEAINNLTADAVNALIVEWRKVVDAENAKAAQTREDNLRKAFDFKEKGKQEPPKPQEPPKGSELTAEQIAAIVAKATEPLQQQIAQLNAGKLNEQRFERLNGLLNNERLKNATAFKDVVKNGFNGKQFADDAAFDAYLEETKKSIDAFVQQQADLELKGNGSPLFGKVNTDGISASVADYIKSKQDNADALGGKKL